MPDSKSPAVQSMLNEQAKQRESAREGHLDKGLEDTFPASDPVSATTTSIPRVARIQMKQLASPMTHPSRRRAIIPWSTPPSPRQARNRAASTTMFGVRDLMASVAMLAAWRTPCQRSRKAVFTWRSRKSAGYGQTWRPGSAIAPSRRSVSWLPLLICGVRPASARKRRKGAWPAPVAGIHPGSKGCRDLAAFVRERHFIGWTQRVSAPRFLERGRRTPEARRLA